MKCNKCGSELNVFRGLLICSNNECTKKYGFDVEDLEEMQYQARLDKVLAKFERETVDNIVCLFKIINEQSFDINMLDEGKIKHYIYTENNGIYFVEMIELYMNKEWVTTLENKISLNTVESLIKDMEEE